MGWTFVDSRTAKHKGTFKTLEDAVAYCKKNGFAFHVERANLRAHDSKTYADNFVWKGPPKN